MPSDKADLFISHCWGSSVGGVYALQEITLTRIVSPLKAAGYKCWVDIEQMPGAAVGGGDLPEAMALGITASSAVIVCLSPQYAASFNCKREAKYAERARRPIFFVNVGAPPNTEGRGGYTPLDYDRDNEEEVKKHGWLDVIVSDALWADFRSDSLAASPAGLPFLCTALSRHPQVRRGGVKTGAVAAASSSAKPPGSSPLNLTSSIFTSSNSTVSSNSSSSTSSSTSVSLSAPTFHSASSLDAFSGLVTRWDEIALLPDAVNPRVLGTGGFGRVLLGLWKGITQVAVKELHAVDFRGAMSKSKQGGHSTIDCNDALIHGAGPLQCVFRRFLQEANVMYRVRHPHVVSCLRIIVDVPGALARGRATGEARSPIAMILELMESDGRDYLIKRNMDGDGVENALRLRLASDTAEGLCYLHSEGVIHGDVKLANVLIAADGRAKIADFGMARMRTTAQSTLSSLSKGAAGGGGLGGTAAFLAPELSIPDADGCLPAPGRRSDVFAFGVLLWEIFSDASVPFPNVAQHQIISLVAKGERPNLEKLVLETPREISDHQ